MYETCDACVFSEIAMNLAAFLCADSNVAISFLLYGSQQVHTNSIIDRMKDIYVYFLTFVGHLHMFLLIKLRFMSSTRNSFDMIFPLETCSVRVRLDRIPRDGLYFVCLRLVRNILCAWMMIFMFCSTKKGALFNIKIHLPLLAPRDHRVQIFL